MKPDQPILTARKLESLAKWFEPTDFQKASGTMRVLLRARDYEGAAALLQQAAEQLERYQTLLAQTIDKSPEPRGPRPRASINATGRGRSPYSPRS